MFHYLANPQALEAGFGMIPQCSPLPHSQHIPRVPYALTGLLEPESNY